MRRFISIISILIVVFSFTVTSFSFEIDGINDATEWEDAQSVLLFSGEESNSNVNFGALMWAVEDSSLYLCFNFIEPDYSEENSNIGVAFSVDDSETYTITVTEAFFGDSEKYRVEGDISVNIAKGATCEVRVGFKYGIPGEINGKVRFIDSEGSYSNIYDFCLENNISSSYDDSYISDQKDTSKTTKPTTTKVTTTKAAKTTKAKTTKAPKTTTEKDNNGLNLFNFLNRDETTEKETAVKTTKNKTTKATKTTKSSKKSDITAVAEHESSITAVEDSLTSGIADTTVAAQNANIIQTSITTTQGKKYQFLTAVACGIALLTVVILGASGANKKAEKDAKRSDAKTENESDKSSEKNNK